MSYRNKKSRKKRKSFVNRSKKGKKEISQKGVKMSGKLSFLMFLGKKVQKNEVVYIRVEDSYDQVHNYMLFTDRHDKQRPKDAKGLFLTNPNELPLITSEYFEDFIESLRSTEKLAVRIFMSGFEYAWDEMIRVVREYRSDNVAVYCSFYQYDDAQDNIKEGLIVYRDIPFDKWVESLNL